MPKSQWNPRKIVFPWKTSDFVVLGHELATFHFSPGKGDSMQPSFSQWNIESPELED